MTLDELITHLRTRILRDKAVPPLWSSEELTVYLNEAQDQFARRTHCLADSTSAFTFVETEVGTTTYELDPRIVFVKEVAMPDGRLLQDMSRKRLGRSWGNARPRAYSMDASMRVMRLSCPPDAVYELDLLVARKPLEALEADDDVPEIDEDYHLALCDWAAYRALRNNDSEGSAVLAADGFRADWEIRVRDAKRDVFRLRSGANPRAVNNWTGKVR